MEMELVQYRLLTFLIRIPELSEWSWGKMIVNV